MKELQEETRKKLVDGLISMDVKQENIYNPETKYWNETVDLSGVKIRVVKHAVGNKYSDEITFTKGDKWFAVSLTNLVRAAICNSSFSGIGMIPYKQQ